MWWASPPVPEPPKARRPTPAPPPPPRLPAARPQAVSANGTPSPPSRGPARPPFPPCPGHATPCIPLYTRPRHSAGCRFPHPRAPARRRGAPAAAPVPARRGLSGALAPPSPRGPGPVSFPSMRFSAAGGRGRSGKRGEGPRRGTRRCQHRGPPRASPNAAGLVGTAAVDLARVQPRFKRGEGPVRGAGRRHHGGCPED
jgi:hypothetical protein